MEITGDQKAAFWRDGVVCLRQVFSNDWIDKLSRGVENVMNDPSGNGEMLAADGGTGRYFNDYCRWREIDEFSDFVYHSPAAELVYNILNTQYVAFYHEHVLVKESRTNKKTPWHVDQAYYPIEGDQACSLWMPLDPVPMESTLQFVGGSHLWMDKLRPRKFATSNNYPVIDMNSNSVYKDVPDIDCDRKKYNIISYPVQPGDVVVFHMKTLHGAPENMQQISRRVFSTRWLGDDCVMATRPWTTSPPSLGGLQIGDKAVSKEFPQIWPPTQ